MRERGVEPLPDFSSDALFELHKSRKKITLNEWLELGRRLCDASIEQLKQAAACMETEE